MSFPLHPGPRHIGMFESVGIDYIKISYPVSFLQILQKVERFVFASFLMSNSKEPSAWVLDQDICDEQINQIQDTLPIDYTEKIYSYIKKNNINNWSFFSVKSSFTMGFLQRECWADK